MGKKYLDETGLKELCNLILADFEKKQDWMQFTTLPDASLYIGKVVQYTGVTDAKQSKGHFYYSDGTSWIELSFTSSVFIVAELPEWENAISGVLYYVTASNKSYIKTPTANPGWYEIASNDTKKGFEVVDTFPDWNKADTNTIYFVKEKDKVTMYIKDSTIYDSWYTLDNGDYDKIKYVSELPSSLEKGTIYVYTDTDDTNTGLSMSYLVGSEVITNEACGALINGELYELLNKYFKE